MPRCVDAVVKSLNRAILHNLGLCFSKCRCFGARPRLSPLIRTSGLLGEVEFEEGDAVQQMAVLHT